MGRKPTLTIWLLGIVVLLLLGTLTLTAAPQSSGGSYTLNWTAVTGGGQAAVGGSYSLVATSGEAAVTSSSAGSYTLISGFMAGVVPGEYALYLPMVLRP